VEGRIKEEQTRGGDVSLLLEARDEIDEAAKRTEEARAAVLDKIARITASLNECQTWIQGPLANLDLLTDVSKLVEKTDTLTTKAEMAVIDSIQRLQAHLARLQEASIAIADHAVHTLSSRSSGDAEKDIEQMERIAKLAVALEFPADTVKTNK
jgi:hypothetical protein